MREEFGKMENHNQNHCGCAGGRTARNMYGSYPPMRTARPAPGCGCQNRMAPRGDCTEWNNYPIGMAYVPWQKFRDLYSREKGLCAGTLFRELDKPFQVGRCAK